MAIPSNEASALFGMARVERKLGDLCQARTRIETALERVETLRTSARQEDLRIAYFVPKRDYYSFYIDLLMGGSTAASQELATTSLPSRSASAAGREA